jgi:putative alpha-1,2-mannosidase
MEDDIRAEVTVADKVAIHRYTAEGKEPFKIAVDISNDGLKQPWDERVFAYSSESEIRIEDKMILGYVVMQGVKLYYCILGAGVSALWVDKKVVDEQALHLEEIKVPFGCLFENNVGSVTLKIGFSLVSEESAKKAVLSAPNFDEAKENASKAWQKRLSTIELYGVSEEDREIFYSNYYHTLIKPCAWNNESFLWREKGEFYLDFATLWDVYKTQMPLLFTLHGDVGKGIVKTLLRYGKEKGKLFNSLLLSSNMNIESTQACCLGCYVLYDAYIRGLIDFDELGEMFAAVKSEIGQYEKSIKDGTFEKTTKLLDCTLISAAFAELAKKLGRESEEQYFSEIAKYWTDAFGSDGLLKDGYPYYEGNRWNYSFRFVKDIQKRIELGGGKERLKKQLDAFFAFSDENEQRNRFEGFNNETDMETPYFYHYIGEYNRLADILDECVTNCFKKGRNGLPGNNDSGGLSACYLWNFLGLFPISGQDKFFIGKPRAKKSILHLANGRTLTIVAMGEGKGIDAVTINGEILKQQQSSVEQIMQGGEIVFYKAEK